MTRKTFIFLSAAILAMIFIMLGCSQNNVSSDNKKDSIAARFGGFTPTDELPYFGDPELAATLSADKAYDDSMANTNDSLFNDSAISIFAVRIVWGRLSYDSNVTTLTDWSGSLQVSRGIELLRRTINFEAPGDYILPRTDPTLIEWVSNTSVFHDGIFVNLYVPPVSADTTEEPVTLAFNTAPFQLTLNLRELNALDTVFYLDDSNAVAIHAFRFNWMSCPRGFLSGFWGTNDSGLGIFYGNWMTPNGIVLGQVLGNWGREVDSLGDVKRIFYGKYIDITGKFEGLLRGRFGPQPNWHASMRGMERAGGWFKGNFFDADENILGELRGRYKSRPKLPEDGFFHGRWKVFCPAEIDDGDDLDD